jgi:hypothetical protein
MNNHEVVKKLIGKISPTAESNTDEERLENLKAMCYLAEMILMDISDVSVRNKHDNHGSVKKIADYASNFLNINVRQLID